MAATTDPCQKIAEQIAALEAQVAADQEALQKATIPEQRVALEQAIIAINLQIKNEQSLLRQCQGTGTGTGGTGTGGGGVPQQCRSLSKMVTELQTQIANLYASLATALTIEQRLLIRNQIAALGILLSKDRANLQACELQYGKK